MGRSTEYPGGRGANLAGAAQLRRHHEKVLAAIGRAAGEGAEMIVFPETFVPYYPYFSFVMPAVAMGGEHMSFTSRQWRFPGR